MDTLRDLIHKYHDFLTYTIFGTLASLINILTYWIFGHVFHLNYLFSNTIAWFISNVFSFLTNKKWVFQTEFTGVAEVLEESLWFFLFRLVALGLDNLVMFFGISILKWASMLVKILDQVIVGLVNYILSRLVFYRLNHQMVDRLRQRMHDHRH